MKQKLPEIFAQETSEQDLTLLEAALYVAGRPLDLKTLGSIIKTRSMKKTKRLARKLVKRKEKNNGALEILELEDDRFVLQLKSEYTARARLLAMRPLLSEGPLKTLSYIAYNQPVLQSQVIEVRGTKAYNHHKQLKKMGLITLEKAERTKIIKTTKFFADYFGLSHNFTTMKRQLKRKFDEYTKSKNERQR